MAYFKSLSLGLAFICFTSTVLSHYCHHDGQCEGVKVCCAKGMCTYSWLCVWCKDDSDCSGGKKCSLHLSDDRSLCVSPPVTLAPPLTPFTRAKPSTMSEEHGHDENCSTDDDCLSSHVCRDGKCVHPQEDKNPVNRSPLILAASLIVIAILMIFILCSFFLYKRLKRVPHESQTEISRNARPAANTNHETNAALRAGDVFVDIPMEEVSPPLPADGPPPYNSLKFEQQGHGSDEGERVKMQSGSFAFDGDTGCEAVSHLPSDAPPPYDSLEFEQPGDGENGKDTGPDITKL